MSKKTLHVLGLDQVEQWDRIVTSFADHDVYQLSGYVRGLQLHGDGEPILFHYDDGETRGMSVSMKRSVSDDPHFHGIVDDDRYFDLATPYGYGGWLVEGGDAGPLFAAYERWCVRNSVVSEFVRFHPLVQNETLVGEAYEVVPLGETVAMDITSRDSIWSNMTSRNRNMVRKAERLGVRVYNGRSPGLFETFRAIYDATMGRNCADSYYYFEKPFYESVAEDLANNAEIFYAQAPDDTIIAASIMLLCNGRMSYHLSGSLSEYSSWAATNLLLYRAAEWGCAHGCKTLHLGGGLGSSEDGLFRFKRSFSRGDLRRFSVGRKVFDPDVYRELVLMRGGTIADANFFPAYRG